MDFITNLLREYPVLALFLTVGLGFFIGRLKFKTFSLGPVTAVLLVGVAVGQLNIPLSPQIKTMFFMLFLFSIGYSVGPKFFRSLRGMGLKQVFFACLMSAMVFAVTFVVAKIMAYTPGETVGLFGGSQTCSSLLAVGGDAIGNIIKNPEQLKRETDLIPVCYAVTYVFGTLGTVIILGTLGPRMLGGLDYVKQKTAELEAQLDNEEWRHNPANVNALQQVTFRAYQVTDTAFVSGVSVAEVEKILHQQGRTVYVDRLRHADGSVANLTPKTKIYCNDTIVLCGRREFMVENEIAGIGPEVSDTDLLQYPVERIPTLVVSRRLVGKTVGHLRKQKYLRGVVIEELMRNDAATDVTNETVLQKRDTLILVGQRDNLRRATEHIGHMEIPTTRTDITFLTLTIFIGAFWGAIPVMIDKIPISFGISGGSLIAGLVFGWLRTRRPSVGYIPRPALWLMNNLGLNVFIAVIGIDCAPTFFSGLASVGPWLLVAGIVTTTLPLLFGLFLGRYVFKFNPALTLGCCAGTRTCTAALGAVQETLGSNLPTMGYTVTYAVSNILLVIWGIITVILI